MLYFTLKNLISKQIKWISKKNFQKQGMLVSYLRAITMREQYKGKIKFSLLFCAKHHNTSSLEIFCDLFYFISLSSFLLSLSLLACIQQNFLNYLLIHSYNTCAKNILFIHSLLIVVRCAVEHTKIFFSSSVVVVRPAWVNDLYHRSVIILSTAERAFFFVYD